MGLIGVHTHQGITLRIDNQTTPLSNCQYHIFSTNYKSDNFSNYFLILWNKTLSGSNRKNHKNYDQ